MAAEIEKLIERLEKLTGPDARVDDAIQAHCVPRSERTIQAPRFTKSIDAALTLVPEDCDYIRFVHDPSGSGWEIGKFSGPTMEYTKLGFGVSGGLFAIALCIAALRALSYKGSSND